MDKHVRDAYNNIKMQYKQFSNSLEENEMESPELGVQKNAKRAEALLAIYHECNEHAREQAKQRNEMITIYLALFAAYFGLMSSNLKLTSIIKFGLLGVMLVIGFLFSQTIIDYRCWIIRYLSSARAIMAVLMHLDGDLTTENLSTQLWEGMHLPKTIREPFFFRMGNLVVVLFIILTTTPAIFLIDQMNGLLTAIIGSSILVTYLAILIRALRVSVQAADNEGSIKEIEFIRTSQKDDTKRRMKKQKKIKAMPWMIDFSMDRNGYCVMPIIEKSIVPQQEAEKQKTP